MSSKIINNRPQNAQLNSNGDLQFNQSADYTTLADFCLGNCTESGVVNNRLRILDVSESIKLNGTTEATLRMTVNNPEDILRAWVEITPPYLKSGDSGEPTSELPEIELQCNNTQLCSIKSDEFDLNGAYQLTFYVRDNKGQLAIPKTTTLTQTQGRSVTTNACLDADGNGSRDALTDGLLSIRYLFGIRGDSLIKNAVASNCVNCSAAELESILEQCSTTGTFDIDGNGAVDALTDGLLMIRYLLGIRGKSLIKDAVADGCSRCSIVGIENYLQ